jgi:phage FluMu protein Com
MEKEIFTITCWHCKKEFGYEEPEFRDVTCPHCKIMNSFYDPGLALPEEIENNT